MTWWLNKYIYTIYIYRKYEQNIYIRFELMCGCIFATYENMNRKFIFNTILCKILWDFIWDCLNIIKVL